MEAGAVGFLTELDATPIGEVGILWWRRCIWRNNSVLRFRDEKGNIIEVPIGFQHDFCSVPRWIPFIYSVFGDTSHREGVLHDYVFRKDSKPPVSFMRANNLFKMAAISRGKKASSYLPMYLAIVVGGIFSFHKLPVNHQFFPDYDFA